MGVGDLLKLLGADVGGPQFIPALLASVIGAWVLPTVAGSRWDALSSLQDLKTTDKLAVAAGCAVIIALFFRIAGITQIQLYEGYLGPRLLLDRLRARQSTMRNELLEEMQTIVTIPREQRTPTQRRRLIHLEVHFETRMPREERLVLPTRLGNAFRTLEGYPNSRYGFDGVALWSRLEPLLPDHARKNVDRARGFVDLLLTSTSLVVLYAATILILRPGGWRSWLEAGLLLALSVGLYRMAVTATIGLGSATKAAFDIGREPLLKLWGYDTPPSPDEEKKIWDEISGLVLYGEELTQNRGSQRPTTTK